MAEENSSEIKVIGNSAIEENNTSEVKEIENCFDTNPQEMMSEEGSARTVIVKDVGNVDDVALKECVLSKTNEVPKTPCVSLRRHSIGAIGTHPAGKLEVQSRYRGNHHVPSTHDLCKHGKLRDHRDDEVKPWKVVRRTSVGGSEVIKAETTPRLRRASLGSLGRQVPGATPESYVAAKRDALSVKKKPCEEDRETASTSVDGSSATSNYDKACKKNKGTETTLSKQSESCAVVKRDALAVKKKPCGSVNSETSSVKEDGEMTRSVDGLSVRSNDKAMKNKGTESTLSGGGGSSVVKKVLGFGSEKSSSPKILKNKEKAKAQTISGEDVKEKTVCVVEASVVKGVQSEKQASSEKKTMRSRLKSLATPTKQVPGTLLTMKKENGDAELVAKKIRPKKIGVRATLAKQLSSKRGKTLEPKLEELETQTEGRKKKNLKGVVETKYFSCEGSKREKVALRRRKVEGKKKMMTLFNSVIEDTMNKLIKVRKSKVKALVGAFESVISLQDTKTPQSKAATSESKATPLGSKQ